MSQRPSLIIRVVSLITFALSNATPRHMPTPISNELQPTSTPATAHRQEEAGPACAVARTAGQQTEQRLYEQIEHDDARKRIRDLEAVWLPGSSWAGLSACNVWLPAPAAEPRAPAGNVGMERFRRTRPARCTLRQRCKSNSCAQAIKQGVFGSLLGTAWLGSREAGSHGPAASEPGSGETRSRFVSREPG